jgi:cellulose synthase/poly-beta-1,6-N-acetylglucosamine synthase-like glycosyltransferase
VARRTSVAVIVGLAYLGAMEAWVYLIANTTRHSESPWDSDGLFFTALGLHFVVGFLTGRFSAVSLPVAAGLLAIPAGYAYSEHAGEFDFFPVIPIWAGILLASLIFIPVMIPGIFLGAWIRFRGMTRGQHISRAQGG